MFVIRLKYLQSQFEVLPRAKERLINGFGCAEMAA
jgi:hypothetical protein